MSAAAQLAQRDIDNEWPLLLPRWDGTNNDKTLLFSEEDLSELYFDIIADIDTFDDNYDPD
eukprot:8344070-Ditylum_brightwellii.AAC.1